MVWIYWRTPEEWASLVEGWVDATGQKGSVLTVYELVEGDGSRGAGEFFFFLFAVFCLGWVSGRGCISGWVVEE
jgi:ESCRT-II complex subunit VPS25